MGDPIARVQNPYPNNIVEFVKNLPKTEMSKSDFRKYMENCKWGAEKFFTSYYQICCQVGLYYEDSNDIYHPRFTRDITEEEALEYLRFWFSRYYIPNPYTKGFTGLQSPIFIEYSIYEYLITNNKNNSIESICLDLFKEPIGNPDIFINAINKYSQFINVENKHCFIKEGADKMEAPNSRNDRKAFFDNFNAATSKASNEMKLPEQIIYYGVPGSGKSFAIDKLINQNIITKTERDNQIIRIVFHPEYSNADFVGQILPKYDEQNAKVDYFFNPGPFTKILKKAYANPELPFYLVIEEINRGNAAAIFGELFQLLDRDENGESCYFVNNDDINYEIRKDLPELNWNENTGIRLPANLSLLATMNTSDQNVFTLDNAFQRRWNMKLVENKFGNSDDEITQEKSVIENTDITWGKFHNVMNEEISRLSVETGLSSMEDKRLGCWFVKNKNKQIDKDIFAEKVLKYLWDDAFKFSREKIFNDYKNLEELASEYKTNGFKNIFKEQLFNTEGNEE